MSDLADFEAVYDELTDLVMGATHHYLPGHLQSWFENLDTTPVVTAIVAYLEAKVDFDSWYREQKDQAKSAGIGGGRLVFSKDKDRELGMKLQLFRKIASGSIEAYQIGYSFLPSSGGDAVTHTNNVKDQFFLPLARELRRSLLRQIEGTRRQETATTSIPAADRVVRIDHNSTEYRQTVEALDRLEHTLRTANDFDDVEEKEQRIAEVQASKTLLQAVRVRAQALIELLRPLVAQFGNKLKDNLITIAVGSVITALSALLKIVGLL